MSVLGLKYAGWEMMQDFSVKASWQAYDALNLGKTRSREIEADVKSCAMGNFRRS